MQRIISSILHPLAIVSANIKLSGSNLFPTSLSICFYMTNTIIKNKLKMMYIILLFKGSYKNIDHTFKLNILVVGTIYRLLILGVHNRFWPCILAPQCNKYTIQWTEIRCFEPHVVCTTYRK